jgi:hypothetical protein
MHFLGVGGTIQLQIGYGSRNKMKVFETHFLIFSGLLSLFLATPSFADHVSSGEAEEVSHVASRPPSSVAFHPSPSVHIKDAGTPNINAPSQVTNISDNTTPAPPGSPTPSTPSSRSPVSGKKGKLDDDEDCKRAIDRAKELKAEAERFFGFNQQLYYIKAQRAQSAVAKAKEICGDDRSDEISDLEQDLQQDNNLAMMNPMGFGGMGGGGGGQKQSSAQKALADEKSAINDIQQAAKNWKITTTPFQVPQNANTDLDIGPLLDNIRQTAATNNANFQSSFNTDVVGTYQTGMTNFKTGFTTLQSTLKGNPMGSLPDFTNLFNNNNNNNNSDGGGAYNPPPSPSSPMDPPN